MQKRASESMEDPKKKMCDWRHKRRDCWEEFKFNHPWKACSLQYGVLALVVFLVGHVLFSMVNHVYFRYPYNDTSRHPFSVTANLTINGTDNAEIYAAEMYADNVRSILCTLVGSEAAIVAIVISLTLIAIELTASEYSPRVIKISIRNPDMWILLLIYGISIFYALVLIKQVPHDSRMLFEDVSLAFWLGVFSYVALAPYMWNIIQLLDPTHIVKRVSVDIVKDNILKYIRDPESEKVKNNKENPIQPILDIIYRSINNYDLETVRKGLGEIVTHANTVIDSSEEKKMSFSKYFCDPLKRIARLAASKDDEGSTIEVIKTLQTIGEHTANAEPNVATGQVAVALGAVGKISAEKGKAFEDAVNEAAESLKMVGKTAVDNNLEDVVKVVATSLGMVGKAAADKEKKLEDSVKKVALALKEVGIAASEDKEKKLENAVTQVASSLSAVGVAATDNGKELEDAAEQVISSIGDVGEAAAKNELPDATWRVAQFIGDVGEAAAKNELPDATWQAAVSLEAVGDAAAGNGLKNAKKRAVVSLEDVGKAAVGKELKNATEQVVSSIGAIGEAAADNGKELEDVLKQAVTSLLAVGEAAVDNGKELEDALKQTATFLAELTILSPEIIESTIHDYESELEEPDRNSSFQKLKKLYVVELKNLRPSS